MVLFGVLGGVGEQGVQEALAAVGHVLGAVFGVGQPPGDGGGDGGEPHLGEEVVVVGVVVAVVVEDLADAGGAQGVEALAVVLCGGGGGAGRQGGVVEHGPVVGAWLQGGEDRLEGGGVGYGGQALVVGLGSVLVGVPVVSGLVQFDVTAQCGQRQVGAGQCRGQQ